MDEIQIIAIKGGTYVTHHAISEYKGYVVNSVDGDLEKGSTYCFPRANIVARLDNKKSRAFVIDKRTGKKAFCGVMQEGNVRFLRTYADGFWNDNLLSLPQY